MGRVNEKLMDLMEEREAPTGRNRRFDTTGYRPQRLTPDEQWKKQGYYPDGEKYDDDSDEVTYDNLEKTTEFDPKKAEKAREEALKSSQD